jgi:nitrogenase molybdenum-iron protein alpha/beta subunit
MKKNNNSITYKSSFLDDLNINIVFKGDDDYEQLKEIFDEYGYGFFAPEFRLIIINGEVFLNNDDLSFDDLKFIEAHEVAHLILNHNGDRNKADEIEADLGAYLLLKDRNMSTERLECEFQNRHGIPFSKDMLLTFNFNL